MPKGRMINKHSIPIAVRLFVIKRDKNTCQYCGKSGVFIFRYGKPTVVENPNGIELNEYTNYNGSDVIAFEIDHILARFNGGNNNPDNLALSCRKCNRGKRERNAKR